ncbi:hypothetical protein O4H52_08010 [Sphingomonadaceae bacterium G21617-S1]|nr:hypothetical protein [Sphingomonadaceae bacterium G21617-S1]
MADRSTQQELAEAAEPVAFDRPIDSNGRQTSEEHLAEVRQSIAELDRRMMSHREACAVTAAASPFSEAQERRLREILLERVTARELDREARWLRDLEADWIRLIERRATPRPNSDLGDALAAFGRSLRKAPQSAEPEDA